MSPGCRIAIVGGGLAGLAAANALRAFGMKAEVFETAAALGEIGAAVNVSPQAAKALQAIGLGDKIAAVAHLSRGIYTRNMQTGEFLEFNDRHKAAERYGAPYYTFHRADLLDALASGLDHGAIHLGHRLTGLEERSDRIILAFANGAEVEAEFVIGADGVRSVVRQALYGDDNPDLYGPDGLARASERQRCAGGGARAQRPYPVGRARLPFHRLLHPPREAREHRHPAGHRPMGRGRLVDPRRSRRDAASFPNPEPRLETLLSRVTECSKWGLFTRPLTQNWGRGRIQLIGDAAHAMLPNAGQGACQAFEDAYILARWLEACGDPVEAFNGFRRVRIPRVHGVQRLSLSNARFKHMRDSASQKESIATGTGSVHGNSDWVWGYDPIGEWDKEPSVPTAYAA